SALRRLKSRRYVVQLIAREPHSPRHFNRPADGCLSRPVSLEEQPPRCLANPADDERDLVRDGLSRERIGPDFSHISLAYSASRGASNDGTRQRAALTVV